MTRCMLGVGEHQRWRPPRDKMDRLLVPLMWVFYCTLSCCLKTLCSYSWVRWVNVHRGTRKMSFNADVKEGGCHNVSSIPANTQHSCVFILAVAPAALSFMSDVAEWANSSFCLNQKRVSTRDCESRDQLTELYLRHVIPLPQRSLPNTRWGKKMEKSRGRQTPAGHRSDR